MNNDINNTVIETTTTSPETTTKSKPAKVKKNYPFMTKKQIAERLANDADFLTESLLVLYRRQTTDEVETRDTKYRNARGFMSSHAKAGTELAEKILSGEGLTDEDFGKVSAIVSRYTKQLANHAREVKIAEQPELAEIASVFGC